MKKITTLVLLSFLLTQGFSQTLTKAQLDKKIADKLAATQNYVNVKATNSYLRRTAGMPEQDCNSAIPVCQNVYNTAASYSGIGNQDEIPGNTCLGEDEKNSVWYTFTSGAAGSLAFQISPVNLSDDYDFALYDITNNSCSGISSGAITPVRCNYAADAGVTGLSASGVNASEGADGSNQSSVYTTVAGKTYVLVISNYSSTQSGYSLDFSSGTASIFDNTAPTISDVIAPCGSNILTLQASEQIKCSSVAADGSDFVVTGTGGPYTVTAAEGVNCGSNVSQIAFTVTPALSGVGPWTVGVKTGTDGNTLVDACGNIMGLETRTFVTSPAAASISGPAEVCKGTVFALTASNGTSYTWSGALVPVSQQTLQTISINPTSSGVQNFQVVVDYGSCGTSTANFSVDVKNAPIAGFTSAPSQTICQGNTVNFTNTSSTLLFNPNVYSWSFGDPLSFASNFSSLTDPSHQYNTPGSYNVVLTATPFLSIVGLGCSNTFTQNIIVLANNPTLTVSPSITICPTTSVTLEANGGLTYTWTPIDGLSTTNSSTTIASPTITTIYTVSASGCVSTASQTVEVTVANVPPAIGSIVGSSTVCPNVNGIAYSVNNFSGTTYNWTLPVGVVLSTSGTNTTSAISVNYGNTAGTITVSATNACGTSTATIDVTITTLPVTAVASPSVLCSGTTATITASGATNYSWLPSAGLSATTGSLVLGNPSSTTVYTVVGTTGLCSGTATVMVVLPLSVSANTAICIGSNVALTASGFSSYTWTPSSSLNSANGPNVIATPLSTTVYTVTGSDATSCIGVNTVTVTINSKPTLVINAPNICINTTTTLNVSGASTYTWSNGSTSSNLVVNPSSSTIYTVSGANSLGCISTQTTLVTVSNPQASFTGMNNASEPVETILSLQNSSTGAGSILWKTCNGNTSSLQNISLPLSDTGVCCVTLYAFQNTCVDSLTKCVSILPKTYLAVPNVFTPNSDNNNDVFTLTAINIGEISMTIFDRWGLKMFETNTTGNVKWDGKTKNGAMVSDGTYFYILKAKGLDGKEYDLKGTINVFK